MHLHDFIYKRSVYCLYMNLYFHCNVIFHRTLMACDISSPSSFMRLLYRSLSPSQGFTECDQFIFPLHRAAFYPN